MSGDDLEFGEELCFLDFILDGEIGFSYNEFSLPLALMDVPSRSHRNRKTAQLGVPVWYQDSIASEPTSDFSQHGYSYIGYMKANKIALE